MSIEVLAEDIFSTAAKRADTIKQETADTIASLEAEKEKEQQEFLEKLTQQYEEEFQSELKRLNSFYERESSTIVLGAKSDVLTNLRSQCLTNLYSLEESKKRALYKQLITQAKNILDFKVVYTSKADSSLVGDVVEKNIVVKTKPQFQGLLFESEDGFELLDCSLDILIDDFFAENEAEIQEKVFN